MLHLFRLYYDFAFLLFNLRERQIQEIEASFEACKTRPVHATNRKLQPTEILPLFPDFDRYIFSTFINLC